MRPVYLDNNATTRVDPHVVDSMLPYFTEHFGNASSVYASQGPVAEALATARNRVRRLVGAEFDDEIVFTSGGTESNNLAIATAVEAAAGRDEIVTTRVEHPAVLECCKHWAKDKGLKIRLVPVDSRGQVDVEAYRATLGSRTALVSLMLANNETGNLSPIEMLADLAHRAGAIFHTDAVQAVGRIPVDVGSSHVDMLSLSGHKFHGPKGVGAIYVRRGVRVHPLLQGGRQEKGRRPGTENVPGIVGLGAAADLALARLPEQHTRVRELRDQLERTILERVKDCEVIGDREHRLANTTNLAFEFVEGHELVKLLADRDIAVSSGSACSSGAIEPSHVLRAMNIPFGFSRGAIRFSLSQDNDAADIDQACSAIPVYVAALREGSPRWQRAQQTRKSRPSIRPRALPEGPSSWL